jgi:hypothetical protein
MARAWLRLAEQADKNNETIVEQILINLITGALGGVGAGKASPTFDLGTIGLFQVWSAAGCSARSVR